MERPMKLVRELRKLDADYEWMKYNRVNMEPDAYIKLCDEYHRIRTGLMYDLADHMKSR